ncbi:MAG: hypothetical protein CL489_02405 [Acidobacteria bacterium]|nr:hypothetical protein [Acidobacteriota bacterium]|tara:strand:+ start:934 stop:1512 length:579 start_codon:yes stop_codon:yes gene_type:complete
MADDRVSRKTAELVPLPPHTWYIRTVGWLLEQPKVLENIRGVPLNTKLRDSLEKHGIKAPFLCMPNWYPIAGSQRMRALADIVIKRPTFLDIEVRVCRFDKEYWLIYYLWGDHDFRDKAVAIWFQMAELVWKSMYYEDDTDPDGISMQEYERIGDQLDWKHTSKLGRERQRTQNLKGIIDESLEENDPENTS